MKKHIYTIAFLFSICTLTFGQQLAQSSFTEAAKHYWNPAATGVDNNMKTSLFFRQQWIGFGSSAPQTGFLSFQYPFVDMNMSAGAIVNFDQTGPISKKGLQLTYAYKLKGIIGDDSQLSLGINAGFQQYAFDPSNESFIDAGDQLLQGGSSSSLYSVIGGGLYYLSSTKEYDENVFFFGLAMRNGIATSAKVNGFNQPREGHLHFNAGTRIYQQNSFIEPSITMNYVAPEFVDLRVGFRYELEDAYWAGLGYSTINEVSLQGGIIFTEFYNQFGTLRISALGNFGLSSTINDLGPGIEIFIGYAYDIN